MSTTKAYIASLILLTGCVGSLAPVPPPQLTPEDIQNVNIRLSVISASPVMTWKAGAYAVRSGCYAYLNQMAARSAGIGVASGGIGVAGPAAAGFLFSGGNPVGAAAATGLASLAQTFLGLYNSSGALPYTPETSAIILQALNAYEAGADLSPPRTAADAVSYVDDLWWQCSAGGYAGLVSRAITSSNVSVVIPRSYGFATPSGRPTIVVNPTPESAAAIGQPIPTPRPKRRATAQRPQAAQTTVSSLHDPGWADRQRLLKATMTYIPALDGPR